MAYITREDGERFVIPSYRDVLTAKQKSALKKEILLLSQSYGEYITLQRKGTAQYEIAFSPDPGYLLGESIWHFFKRPLDMIYCEAIPNTTEAILVIVKAGSVYLDGSFPLESISEELVIFLTQQNNFEIYTYGDVPVSEHPEEGKFSFEASSVKSFTTLDQPVFPTLPLLKIYQLQLVEPVLKAHGIGVFPVRQLLIGVVVMGIIWMVWSYISSSREQIPQIVAPISPYQAYFDTLSTPAPDQEINQFLTDMGTILTIPGWQPLSIKYAKGTTTAVMQSTGSQTETLLTWAKENNATVMIKSDGIYLSKTGNVPKRPRPKTIYPLKEVLANFIDQLAIVYPGNHLSLSEFSNKTAYTDVTLTIKLEDVSPSVIALIGNQTKDLPFVLQGIILNVTDGSLSGSIILEALGS